MSHTEWIRAQVEDDLVRLAEEYGRYLAQRQPGTGPRVEPCRECGCYRQRRAGTCTVCENCGASGGCG